MYASHRCGATDKKRKERRRRRRKHGGGGKRGKNTVKLRGFIEVFLTLKAPRPTVRLGCPRDWERETEREREGERERETLVWFLALHAAAGLTRLAPC